MRKLIVLAAVLAGLGGGVVGYSVLTAPPVLADCTPGNNC
jgi:hypothetical protein